MNKNIDEKNLIKIGDFYYNIDNKLSNEKATYTNIYLKDNDNSYIKVHGLTFPSRFSLETVHELIEYFIYKEIGKINSDGTIEKGKTEQGYVYKNYENFFKREGICYIPEYGESTQDGVTFDDIINEVKQYLVENNINLEKIPQRTIENMAFDVFDTVDWQYTSTLIDDDWLEGWIEDFPPEYFSEEFLSIDDISNELKKLDYKVNRNEFWKMIVLEIIQNNMEQSNADIKVTREDIDRIVLNIGENDYLWQEIDAEINRVINEPKENYEEESLYSDKSLQVYDKVQNELSYEDRLNIYKSETGKTLSSNNEFWEWFEGLDSDEILDLVEKYSEVFDKYEEEDSEDELI